MRFASRLSFSLLITLSIVVTTVTTTLSQELPANSGATANAQAEINAIQNQGAKLEASNTWRAALKLYERAARNYPQQSTIAARFQISRSHVDIARRYHDASYLYSIKQMEVTASQAVYREVLGKIETYYFAELNWQQILKSGIDQIEVALHDELFRGHHGLTGNDGDLQQYRDEVAQILTSRVCRNGRDVLQSAIRVSQIAERTLKVSQQAVMLELLSGTIIALDRYSSYLTSTQLDDMFSQIDGKFVGLGIELRIQGTHLLVERVIPKGPAADAGLKSGDKIIEVDRNMIPTVDAVRAADLLKGLRGTEVEIVVVSASGSARRMTLTRRQVQVASVVDARIIDQHSKVGYLRIVSFQKNTARELNSALWQLRQDGMQRLVLDLRGNPGGLVKSAVEIADMFIRSGTIVSTRGRSVNEEVDYQAHQSGTCSEPLVVLINARSASASEIFAGAIKDHKRGAIVGHCTYGKGSVQGIFPLASYNCGLRLTTARFYSPDGHQISGRGVTPDVDVQMIAKPLEDGTLPLSQADPILFAGIEIVKGRRQIAAR
jgi:carboxyl-terminal processing protease